MRLDKNLISELEAKIGYTFENKSYLKLAMTHSSYANEMRMKKNACNERVEFLGDAVLELVTSEYLYSTYNQVDEGELTKTRASIVCEPTLFNCAKTIDLGKYIMLGKGEFATGGNKRPSIISDAMESLIGAIYLDGGFTNAKEFIHKFILTDIEDKRLFFDSKTILQEIVQGQHIGKLRYELVREEGPDHNKSFTCAVVINNDIIEKGEGKSKKAAEQEAAYKSIMKLRSKKENN